MTQITYRRRVYFGVLVPALVRVTIVVMKHHTKATCRENGYLEHAPKALFITEESQGRNLEVKSHAEAMERYCLLACSP